MRWLWARIKLRLGWPIGAQHFAIGGNVPDVERPESEVPYLIAKGTGGELWSDDDPIPFHGHVVDDPIISKCGPECQETRQHFHSDHFKMYPVQSDD